LKTKELFETENKEESERDEENKEPFKNIVLITFNFCPSPFRLLSF
jgi:hypothetical protein